MLAIDPYTMEPAYFRVDDTQTKFVGTAALGIVPMLSPNLGLECCFDWDLVFVGTTKSETYGDQVQVASVLDFRVGLTYVFK
jgi:hypothetical protein